MAEVVVPLSEPITAEHADQFKLFHYRVNELQSNWDSLLSQGLRIGGSFSRDDYGRIRGDSCGVEIHRLKGLYLDFRFFYAQGERTHFYAVAKQVDRVCSDPRIRKVTTRLRSNWKEPGFLHGWHRFEPDKLFDAMFNGELFHSGKDKVKQLERIQAVMNDELAHHCLVDSISSRILVLRQMDVVLQPVLVGHNGLKLPERFQ